MSLNNIRAVGDDRPWKDEVEREVKSILNTLKYSKTSFRPGTVTNSPENPEYTYKTGRYYDTIPVAVTGQDSMSSTNRMWFYPFIIRREINIKSLSVQFSGSPTSGSLRIGIYSNLDMAPNTLILDAGTVATTANAIRTISGLDNTLSPGVYWMVTWSSNNNGGNIYSYLNSASSSLNLVGKVSPLSVVSGGAYYLTAAFSTFASSFSTYGTIWGEIGTAHQVQMGT